jgi:hypothetical protein|tara:strand:- start:6250 stop:7287 length:1038 start_codon:yes stop_codon:yes gene_type:complete
MVVYTGAGSSVFYGYESAFGAGATYNKVFGLNTRVSSLSVTTNRIELGLLGQVEPTAFAYGQQQARMGVSFTFDSQTSHNIFQGIYGEVSSSKYPASLGEGALGASPDMVNKTLSAQISIETPSSTGAGSDYGTGTHTKMVRTLKGGIINSLGITANIGETINGNCDMTFGKEETVSNPATGSIVEQDTVGVAGSPYTFAHGVFKVSDGSALQTLGEVQSVDVTFNQNTELLYKLGSHYATDSFRKVLDVSGRFKTSWKEGNHLQHVLNQAIGTGYDTKGGINQTSGVSAELTFTSTEDSGKEMKIEFKGISFGDHTVTGLEPVEPVFEELSFKAQAARVTYTIA